MIPNSSVLRIYFFHIIFGGSLALIIKNPPSILIELLHPYSLELLIIIAAQNLITTSLINSKIHEVQSFPIFVIASFVFRLIIAFVLLTLAWVFEVSDYNSFGINLLALYLVYLTFELIILLNTLRQNSERT